MSLLQKKPIILSILLTVATPYQYWTIVCEYVCTADCKSIGRILLVIDNTRLVLDTHRIYCTHTDTHKHNVCACVVVDTHTHVVFAGV